MWKKEQGLCNIIRNHSTLNHTMKKFACISCVRWFCVGIVLFLLSVWFTSTATCYSPIPFHWSSDWSAMRTVIGWFYLVPGVFHWIKFIDKWNLTWIGGQVLLIAAVRHRSGFGQLMGFFKQNLCVSTHINVSPAITNFLRQLGRLLVSMSVLYLCSLMRSHLGWMAGLCMVWVKPGQTDCAVSKAVDYYQPMTMKSRRKSLTEKISQQWIPYDYQWLTHRLQLTTIWKMSTVSGVSPCFWCKSLFLLEVGSLSKMQVNL